MYDVLVIGGGVIGCEMAFIYRAFGAQVTVVEGQDRLLPMPSMDADVSTLLQREMKKRRITCELGLISCVEPQTLKGCFEILAQGGMAEGAELILQTAPLPCRCTDCGHTFELHRRHFTLSLIHI